MRDLPSPFGGPLPFDTAQNLAGVLKAAADPSRLQIISHMYAAGVDGIYTTELGAALGGAITQPTISHHVRILTDAGLVLRGHPHGLYVPLTVDEAGFTALSETLRPKNRRAVRHA